SSRGLPVKRNFVQPIIDIHVHIMPYSMMKPSAMELMKKGRRDYADVERYCADPKAFLAFLDTLGVERAGLINYVAPRIIGFTPEVNDWSAQYCSAAPDRLIAFGGVLPGTVRDPGAEGRGLVRTPDNGPAVLTPCAEKREAQVRTSVILTFRML